MGKAPPTTHGYNLPVSMSARNVPNHTNPGPIIGNITSRLFGRANQVAAGAGGGGFSENADNRRLEMQLRLAFWFLDRTATTLKRRCNSSHLLFIKHPDSWPKAPLLALIFRICRYP